MALYGEAKRAYNRRWVAARRQAWIDSKGGACALCGSTDSLEVDHIDRATKEREPRDLWTRNEITRANELAKCQVLCSDCHKAKTIAEATTGLVHGTITGYCRYACRCDACREANTEQRRAYRARRRAEMASQAA